MSCRYWRTCFCVKNTNVSQLKTKLQLLCGMLEQSVLLVLWNFKYFLCSGWNFSIIAGPTLWVRSRKKFNLHARKSIENMPLPGPISKLLYRLDLENWNRQGFALPELEEPNFAHPSLAFFLIQHHDELTTLLDHLHALWQINCQHSSKRWTGKWIAQLCRLSLKKIEEAGFEYDEYRN